MTPYPQQSAAGVLRRRGIGLVDGARVDRREHDTTGIGHDLLHEPDLFFRTPLFFSVPACVFRMPSAVAPSVKCRKTEPMSRTPLWIMPLAAFMRISSFPGVLLPEMPQYARILAGFS